MENEGGNDVEEMFCYVLIVFIYIYNELVIIEFDLF